MPLAAARPPHCAAPSQPHGPHTACSTTAAQQVAQCTCSCLGRSVHAPAGATLLARLPRPRLAAMLPLIVCLIGLPASIPAKYPPRLALTALGWRSCASLLTLLLALLLALLLPCAPMPFCMRSCGAGAPACPPRPIRTRMPAPINHHQPLCARRAPAPVLAQPRVLALSVHGDCRGVALELHARRDAHGHQLLEQQLAGVGDIHLRREGGGGGGGSNVSGSAPGRRGGPTGGSSRHRHAHSRERLAPCPSAHPKWQELPPHTPCSKRPTARTPLARPRLTW